MSVEMDGFMYTWTTPCCASCWMFMNPDGRMPVQVRRLEGEPIKWETCGNCGTGTADGIYIRRDPRTIRYPALEEQ